MNIKICEVDWLNIENHRSGKTYFWLLLFSCQTSWFFPSLSRWRFGNLIRMCKVNHMGFAGDRHRRGLGWAIFYLRCMDAASIVERFDCWTCSKHTDEYESSSVRKLVPFESAFRRRARTPVSAEEVEVHVLLLFLLDLGLLLRRRRRGVAAWEEELLPRTQMNTLVLCTNEY